MKAIKRVLARVVIALSGFLVVLAIGLIGSAIYRLAVALRVVGEPVIPGSETFLGWLLLVPGVLFVWLCYVVGSGVIYLLWGRR